MEFLGADAVLPQLALIFHTPAPNKNQQRECGNRYDSQS
jgi:hypothetical protein